MINDKLCTKKQIEEAAICVEESVKAVRREEQESKSLDRCVSLVTTEFETLDKFANKRIDVFKIGY